MTTEHTNGFWYDNLFQYYFQDSIQVLDILFDEEYDATFQQIAVEVC